MLNGIAWIIEHFVTHAITLISKAFILILLLSSIIGYAVFIGIAAIFFSCEDRPASKQIYKIN